jgi:hypothetical protein
MLRIRFVCLLLLFLLNNLFLFAQNVETVVSRQQLQIGEPFYLIYRVDLKEGETIKYESYQDELPVILLDKNMKEVKDRVLTFEIVSEFKDTIQSEANKRTWIGTYTVIPWDSGYFRIPEPIVLKDSIQLQGEKAFLHVNLVPSVKGKEMYDLEENFSEIGELKFDILMFITKYWIVLLILFIVVLFSIILWKFYKRKKNDSAQAELTLEEKTLIAIEGLEAEGLWRQNKLKEHYVELSFIIRAYLSKRYELNLLEKTTIETRLLLEQKKVDVLVLKRIDEVLVQSDFVKFAKSNPEEYSVLKIGALAREIVSLTSRKKV